MAAAAIPMAMMVVGAAGSTYANVMAADTYSKQLSARAKSIEGQAAFDEEQQRRENSLFLGETERERRRQWHIDPLRQPVAQGIRPRQADRAAGAEHPPQRTERGSWAAIRVWDGAETDLIPDPGRGGECRRQYSDELRETMISDLNPSKGGTMWDENGASTSVYQ